MGWWTVSIYFFLLSAPMLSSFVRTVLSGHLWKGEKSTPSFKSNWMCSRRYGPRHWEMPWYLSRLRGKSRDLAAEIAEEGRIYPTSPKGWSYGDGQRRDSPKGPGSLGRPWGGWSQAWKQGHQHQERISYKHLYISADVTALIFFFSQF